MVDYLLAMGLILLALYCWTKVQQKSRSFSNEHPEFGSQNDEGSDCWKNCICNNEKCAEFKDQEKQIHLIREIHNDTSQ